MRNKSILEIKHGQIFHIVQSVPNLPIALLIGTSNIKGVNEKKIIGAIYIIKNDRIHHGPS